jgi:hypothetical protein
LQVESSVAEVMDDLRESLLPGGSFEFDLDLTDSRKT